LTALKQKTIWYTPYLKSNISLFCPAELTALKQDEHQVSIEIIVDGAAKLLTGKLLVAADGNNSQVLQLLNIGSSRKSYDQVALITNVTPGKKHNNVAYERFTDSGPLAFLPMTDNRCSVVWTLSQEQAEYLYALDEADFLQQLQQRFGIVGQHEYRRRCGHDRTDDPDDAAQGHEAAPGDPSVHVENPRKLARMIVAVGQGLAARARAGAPKDELLDLANDFVERLV